MAMEIHVFFRGTLPTKAALGRTMKELGFPLSVKPATGSLEGHSGYMPMRLRREETGVEFDIFGGRSVIDEFGFEGVDPSLDRVANFRWGGDEDEMLAALCGAAALAKLTNGIVFDEAGDRLLSPDQAIEMAKQHLNAVAPKETKQPGTRPADIKRYLKPLLELRPDLVLIDRMLIIRPVRHLLRGAFFGRTSDKYTFQIWSYLKPLYGEASGLGYGHSIRGWFWPVWQPYFRPLLLDCLGEEVFEWVGKIHTFDDFVTELEVGGTDRPGASNVDSARIEALVLAGKRHRACEYVDEMERSHRDSGYWADWAKEQREFLSRDIEAVCQDFHAKEAETAKALKLEAVWEPAPFPVEAPVSERPSRSADPLFRPTPWLPREPGLLDDPPEVPGEVRFAKTTLYRGVRLFPVVPLTAQDAEERHRNFEPYVLAARLEGGLLALLHWRGNDLLDPDRPRNPVRRRTPDLWVQLQGSDHFVSAEFTGDWDKNLLHLRSIEVDKRGVSHYWYCYFAHEEGNRKIHDDRTGARVYNKSPLTSEERDLTTFPPPEFGHFDDAVRRMLVLLRIAGYGEFA
jgi:hypothetical protein